MWPCWLQLCNNYSDHIVVDGPMYKAHLQPITQQQTLLAKLPYEYITRPKTNQVEKRGAQIGKLIDTLFCSLYNSIRKQLLIRSNFSEKMTGFLCKKDKSF